MKQDVWPGETDRDTNVSFHSDVEHHSPPPSPPLMEEVQEEEDSVARQAHVVIPSVKTYISAEESATNDVGNVVDN